MRERGERGTAHPLVHHHYHAFVRVSSGSGSRPLSRTSFALSVGTALEMLKPEAGFPLLGRGHSGPGDGRCGRLFGLGRVLMGVGNAHEVGRNKRELRKISREGAPPVPARARARRRRQLRFPCVGARCRCRIPCVGWRNHSTCVVSKPRRTTEKPAVATSDGSDALTQGGPARL
jgi:hypothetical protein